MALLYQRVKKNATYQEIVAHEKIVELAKNAGLKITSTKNNASKHLLVLEKN